MSAIMHPPVPRQVAKLVAKISGHLRKEVK